MKYTVKYKTVSGIIWRRIKNVIGDGIIENGENRFFILDDGSRVELATTGMIIRFSPERETLIKERIASESGQTIPTSRR